MLFNVKNSKLALKGSKWNKQLFLICLIFIGLFSACRKESEEVKPQTKTDAIQKAKQWFANRKALSPPLLKSGDNPLTEADREPDWNNTDLQAHLSAPLLEMPLKYDDKYLTSSFRDPETGILKTGITKLLLRQENDSTFKPIIMRIYGDSAYLAQAGNQFEENSFTQIASDFSGEVFYYDWQENFLGANRYNDGQLTGFIKNEGLKSLICVDVTTYYYVQSLPTIGTFNYFDGHWESRTEAHCWHKPDNTNGTINNLPEGNGGGSLPFDPYGGGGGIVNNPPVIPDVSPELLAIVDVENSIFVTEEQWQKIDDKFQQAYQRSCLFRAMHQALVTGQRKFKWNVLENYTDGAFYDNENKAIGISEWLFEDKSKNLLGNVIGEELFHAYQSYFNESLYTITVASGGLGFPNVEFEAKFFTELTAWLSDPPPFDGFDWVFQDKFYPDYEAWLKQISNNFTQFPQNYGVMQSKYFQFVERFKTDRAGTAYDKPINYNFEPRALLNLISISGCTN